MAHIPLPWTPTTTYGLDVETLQLKCFIVLIFDVQKFIEYLLVVFFFVVDIMNVPV